MKASILLFGAAIALASCGGQDPGAQEADETAVPPDIETLPADESAATPTDDLVDGTTDVPADSNLADPTAVDSNATP